MSDVNIGDQQDRTRFLDGFHRVVVSRIGDVIKTLTILFLITPGILVAVLSFSGESSLRFPPRTWGLAQYRSFFDSSYWTGSVGMSFRVAVPAALIALAIGVPATIAVNRTSLPGRGLISGIGLAPIFIPGVAHAVAMYTFFVQIGFMGSVLGLIFVHVILALPFVFIIVGAALNRIPKELELVAMTLGASRLRATVGVTVRLLAPGIAAAFIFAFITSFDEATFVNFVGGPGTITLPKAIFDSVRTGLDPLITAIATILMTTTAVIMAAAAYWRK